MEAQRKAMAEASDPRPDFELLRAGELAVINERCGAKAVDDGKRRWLKKMTPYRRARDVATLVSMMALRSQGFGIVHKEQDVLWIETELLMGGERVTEDRARLLDLGVTHMGGIPPEAEFPPPEAWGSPRRGGIPPEAGFSARSFPATRAPSSAARR